MPVVIVQSQGNPIHRSFLCTNRFNVGYLPCKAIRPSHFHSSSNNRHGISDYVLCKEFLFRVPSVIWGNQVTMPS